MKNNATYIELFAGIGGFGRGFNFAGAECLYANEFDKYAVKTYEANNRIKVDSRDIRKISPSEVPPHDILLAGFPCPSFSIAGIAKRKLLGKGTGFDCKVSGDLFFEAMRFVAYHQPKFVVFENVKNLVYHNKGKTLETIKNHLEDEGYFSQVIFRNAVEWVPQNRERVFIIGSKKNIGDLETDILGRLSPQKRTIREILHDPAEPVPYFPYTYSFENRIEVSPKYTLGNATWECLKSHKKRHKKKGNGFGFVMADREGVSRTLTACYRKSGQDILIKQPGNPRRLTPRECCRLMGFDFGRSPMFKIPVSDTQSYKQFGNAVVPEMSFDIAGRILKFL